MKPLKPTPGSVDHPLVGVDDLDDRVHLRSLQPPLTRIRIDRSGIGSGVLVVDRQGLLQKGRTRQSLVPDRRVVDPRLVVGHDGAARAQHVGEAAGGGGIVEARADRRKGCGRTREQQRTAKPCARQTMSSHDHSLCRLRMLNSRADAIKPAGRMSEPGNRQALQLREREYSGFGRVGQSSSIAGEIPADARFEVPHLGEDCPSSCAGYWPTGESRQRRYKGR